MRAEHGFTVVLITRGRPAMLRECLASVLASGGKPEIIAGVNGTDPESLEVINSFGGAVTAVSLARMCRGEARNALAALARGRWLCFLDDDTVVPAGYFVRLRALIQAYPGTAVFGGGQTLARRAGGFEAAVYSLLASPWGGGPFTARFSPAAGTGSAGPEKFILCNLVLDGEFLDSRGLAFEGHLTSAEENLLLSRMHKAGARMVLSGDLNLVHRRRGQPGTFVSQVFSCGRGRAQMTVLSPKSSAVFTLLPPAALLFALWAAFSAAGILRLGAAGYFLVSLVAAAFSGARAAVKPVVFVLFPVLHISYAAGWVYGLCEGVLEKLSGRFTPRRCCCEEKL